MKKPRLNQIPLKNVANAGSVIVTMSPGQWDKFLDEAYRAGYILLELDAREQPVKAYRKAQS
jgi:hypothetical protein